MTAPAWSVTLRWTQGHGELREERARTRFFTDLDAAATFAAACAAYTAWWSADADNARVEGPAQIEEAAL